MSEPSPLVTAEIADSSHRTEVLIFRVPEEDDEEDEEDDDRDENDDNDGEYDGYSE